MSNNQKGFCFAFSSTFLVSFFPLAFRELGTLHEPLLCVLALFITSLTASFLPMAIKPSRFYLPTGGLIFIIAMAGLSLVGNWSYMQSLQMLEPAISSTIQRVELIFAAILGALFFAEKITSVIVVSIIFSLVGLFFLQGGEFVVNEFLLQAIGVTLLSGLAFAFMLTFSKFAMRYTGVITMNFYRLLIITIVMLFVLDVSKLQELTWFAWLLAAISALCGPAGARFLITNSLKYISMGKALLYAMMAPILTAFWQWLFWDITLNATELLGAGMILLGVLFTILKSTDLKGKNKLQVEANMNDPV